MKSLTTYLLPGLGFDHRCFRNLSLPNPRPLDWIEPLRHETLRDYSKRMAEGIQTDPERTVLIGHSLGGIVAQEIASFRKVAKVILISSIRSRKELPRQFKVVKPLGVHFLFRKAITRWSFPLWAKSQDYVSPEERSLFLDMLDQNSNHYLRWSLRQLSNWQGAQPAPACPVIQIHGTRDKTLPFRLVESPDHVIDGGGHFMVYRRADELTPILRTELATL